MQLPTTHRCPSQLLCSSSLHWPTAPVYIQSMTSCGMDIPLTTLGWLSWLCPFPASCGDWVHPSWTQDMQVVFGGHWRHILLLIKHTENNELFHVIFTEDLLVRVSSGKTSTQSCILPLWGHWQSLSLLWDRIGLCLQCENIFLMLKMFWIHLTQVVASILFLSVSFPSSVLAPLLSV